MGRMLAGPRAVESTGLDDFWQQKFMPSRKGTNWINVLKTLVCYRLIDPGSEWRLHRHWFDQSAMGDLLDEDMRIADLDKLLAHKTELQSAALPRTLSPSTAAWYLHSMSAKEEPSGSTTIVGGRPMRRAVEVSDLPQGVERILTLAALNQRFRTDLLRDPIAAAQSQGIVLDAVESSLLRAARPEQLAAMADRIVIPRSSDRRAFVKTVSASIVAMVTGKAIMLCSGCTGMDTWRRDAATPLGSDTGNADAGPVQQWMDLNGYTCYLYLPTAVAANPTLGHDVMAALHAMLASTSSARAGAPSIVRSVPSPPSGDAGHSFAAPAPSSMRLPGCTTRVALGCSCSRMNTSFPRQGACGKCVPPSGRAGSRSSGKRSDESISLTGAQWRPWRAPGALSCAMVSSQDVIAFWRE
jgi:hypothetical protein